MLLTRFILPALIVCILMTTAICRSEEDDDDKQFDNIEPGKKPTADDF